MQTAPAPLRPGEPGEGGERALIKLVVSDIDGTLLPYGQTALDPAVFAAVRELRRRGVLFCPASGRQYHSVRRLFDGLGDELLWLCENGAILYGRGPEDRAPILHRAPIPRETALELCREILDLPGCQILISGANVSYLCRCTREYARYISENKGNRVALCGDPSEIDEDIVKISAYCPQGTGPYQQALVPRWSGRLNGAVAGPDWLDFTVADKGSGLLALCQALGVRPEETLAFGDNWNDAGMLDRAGTAYIMAGADQALLERYPNHCANVPELLRARMETWFPRQNGAE